MRYLKMYEDFDIDHFKEDDWDWDEVDNDGIGKTYYCIKSWFNGNVNEYGFHKGDKYKLIDIMEDPVTYVFDEYRMDGNREFFYLDDKKKFSDYFQLVTNEDFDWDFDEEEFEEKLSFKIGDRIRIRHRMDVSIERTTQEYPNGKYESSVLGYNLNDKVIDIKRRRSDNELVLKIGAKYPWYLASDIVKYNESINENKYSDFEWGDDDFDFDEESPNQIIGNKHFTDFLIKRDLYDKFIEAVDNCSHNNNSNRGKGVDSINQSIKHYGLYGIIDNLINWSCARRYGVVWSDVSEKWNSLHNSNDKINF